MTINISWNYFRYKVVHFFRSEIVYSSDEKLFYVIGRGKRPRHWLSIEKDPKDNKRSIYEFAYYAINSGKRMFVSHGHRLVRVYNASK